MTVEATPPHKVIFYFPWREVSGGPYFLTQLANELAKDPAYRVAYVDFHHSLSESLLSPDVERMYVPDRNYSMQSDEPCTVITPIYWARWVTRLHPDSRILFINWHNRCTAALLKTWMIGMAEATLFLKLVRDTRAVAFCDEAHRQAQNRPGIVFEKKYLPIILGPRTRRARADVVDDGSMRLCFLGRLSPDKVHSVINLLDNLNRVRTFRKKIVYIIGDGPEKNEIQPHKYKDIDIVMKGTVVDEALDDFLTNEVDILFAMGTSVLNGAALQLPSVIVPHNMHPFYCDQFVYVQNAVGYALGWYDDQIDDLGLKPQTLQSILDDIYGGAKAARGQEAFRYYEGHHAAQSAVSRLKTALAETTLSFPMLADLGSELYHEHEKITITIIKIQKTDQQLYRYCFLGMPIAYGRAVGDMGGMIYYPFGIGFIRTTRERGRLRVHMIWPELWWNKQNKRRE